MKAEELFYNNKKADKKIYIKEASPEAWYLRKGKRNTHTQYVETHTHTHKRYGHTYLHTNKNNRHIHTNTYKQQIQTPTI